MQKGETFLIQKRKAYIKYNLFLVLTSYFYAKKCQKHHMAFVTF